MLLQVGLPIVLPHVLTALRPQRHHLQLHQKETAKKEETRSNVANNHPSHLSLSRLFHESSILFAQFWYMFPPRCPGHLPPNLPIRCPADWHLELCTPYLG